MNKTLKISMQSNINGALIGLSTVLLISGCDTSHPPQDNSVSEDNTLTEQVYDTSKGIKSGKWSENVTLSFDDKNETFRYISNGIPAYGLADAYLVPDSPETMPFSDDPDDSFWTLDASEIQETPIDEVITTRPIYTLKTTETTLGQIGVAINGARIFNDYEDLERKVVALDDNVIHDHAAFVDECNGHPLGDGTSYHYHGVPLCIKEQIDIEGEHSFMIGVLQDGFPAYSDQGIGGKKMTNADLDECGGHIGETPEFPEGIYHYHLTADEAPYSVDCYHGEVEIAQRGEIDLKSIADELGVSEQALINALGKDGPPNLEAAAETLDIPLEKLRAAMPARGDGPPRN